MMITAAGRGRRGFGWRSCRGRSCITDDIIDAENAGKIRQLVLRGVPPNVLGFLMKVCCPGLRENGEAGYIEVDQVKLFRNLPHLRFEFRIHEQILMAIRRQTGRMPGGLATSGRA